MTDQNPQIAFGLRAMTMAMKAKTNRLKMLEAAHLASMHQACIPDDIDAALAVVRFLSDLSYGSVAAGEALLGFLTTWADGVMAVAVVLTENTLTSQTGEAEFDWQTRADICG